MSQRPPLFLVASDEKMTRRRQRRRSCRLMRFSSSVTPSRGSPATDKQPLIVRYGATPKHRPITGGLRTSLLADQYIPPISGAWISGLAQTLIYADFFYYYFSR
ncbi:hypothetical protein BHE74_00019863 [Ensete ventricosum]|nr:hypothetical protein BHE74_00019863 [Ensete ventricosum]